MATVDLKDGETALATGLRSGTAYTVEEIGGTDGFRVSTGVIGQTKVTGNIVLDDTALAAFTNTRITGGLTITKAVTGEGADASQAFGFTVTLSDTTVNGTFDDMTFTNGVAYVTVTPGEPKTASGLPADITYTVTEAAVDGYTPDHATVTGTIPRDDTATAAFLNTYTKVDEEETAKVGSLTVIKTVTGVGADKTKAFRFTVTLSDPTVNGPYGQMTFVNGVASFTLNDGASRTATGLPANIRYTVTEEKDDGYQSAGANATGLIPEDDTVTASFINTKIVEEDEDDGNDGDNDDGGDTGEDEEIKKEEGSLTVSKTVTGAGADLSKDFHFTVTLGDRSISGVYGGMTFINGAAEFSLRHGGSKTATGLPAGVTYTVTEDTAEHYIATKTGAAGTIVTDQTAEAVFVNAYDAGTEDVPKTGDNTHLALWLSLMALSLAWLCLAARKARRN